MHIDKHKHDEYAYRNDKHKPLNINNERETFTEGLHRKRSPKEKEVLKPPITSGGFDS